MKFFSVLSSYTKLSMAEGRQSKDSVDNKSFNWKDSVDAYRNKTLAYQENSPQYKKNLAVPDKK